MNNIFSNKTVVITGAYGGLGREMCIEFGKLGAKIAALGRNTDKLSDLSNELTDLNINHKTFACDIQIQSSCDESMKSILTHFGGVDFLINNAGVTNISVFDDSTHIPIVEKVLKTNFLGAVYLTSPALSSIKKNKGMIINISSVAGFSPLYGRTAYSASKFAMEGFFRSLASEIQEFGAHVMMVYPTFIETGIRTEEEKKKTLGDVLTAKQVCDEIVKGASKRKRTLIIGKLAKRAYVVYKYMPKFYEKKMFQKMANKVKQEN